MSAYLNRGLIVKDICVVVCNFSELVEHLLGLFYGVGVFSVSDGLVPPAIFGDEVLPESFLVLAEGALSGLHVG